MPDYMKAVVKFLAPMGMKVYTAGMAPEGTQFPHMTLQAAYAPFTQNAALTVTIWHRENGGHAACLENADRVWQMIPEGGVLLRLPKGLAVLSRASGGISLVKDADDPDVTGATLRLMARMYDL